ERGPETTATPGCSAARFQLHAGTVVAAVAFVKSKKMPRLSSRAMIVRGAIRELVSDFGIVRRRMGEHGSPRIDTSEHVYFVNDQLAFRFIEEIDFDCAAADATAALITAAS